jgi:hypothetical protein
MSDTPETDAAIVAAGGDWSPVLRAVAQRLERERDEAIRQRNETNESSKYAVDYAIRQRDEARAIADELASVAAHCLGWHDHECPDAAIKIAAALKRWKKSK